VVNADVIIRRPDGEPTRLTLQHAYPTPIKVLFVDFQQVALLQRIIMKLGGTRRRQPQAIMEPPNQPLGHDSDQAGCNQERLHPNIDQTSDGAGSIVSV
jgi:hypothetical protein